MNLFTHNSCQSTHRLTILEHTGVILHISDALMKVMLRLGDDPNANNTKAAPADEEAKRQNPGVLFQLWHGQVRQQTAPQLLIQMIF